MNDPFLARRNEAAELFLIRHGDAIPEADEIIPSGVYDDLPLSRKGRSQARALTGRLKGLSFDAVYCSPLRRCRETAAPLVEHLGLTPVIVEEIKEIRLGRVFPIPTVTESDNLEVLTQALSARQADIVRMAGGAGHWDVIKESEPSKAFRKRVVDAIDAIVQQRIGQRVLVFAHGGVINAYVAEVLGLNKDFFFPCANTSITVVRANSEARVLFVLNDISHLSLLQSRDG
ncbi:MAG TPA: histidine phosphatase family protein [Ktedonobacteraceae bacterium]|nr:histidine phosphatase family protein [Ktedonobacteraceae bacterium]